MRKLLKIFLLFVLTAVTVFSSSVSVCAKTDINHDYTIDAQSGGRVIPIPETHNINGVISYVSGYEPSDGDKGTFANPQDIFIDQSNNIYVADTNNNAVIKLDGKGNLLLNITIADGTPLSKPMGVYVDSDQDIYIADKGNERIVHMSASGEYIETFTAPESELLGQNLAVFDPSKLAINTHNGYIYMIIGKEFLTLDANNTFRGLVGTVPVGFDFIDMIVRRFATEKQKDKLEKREPLPYNNFCITSDNKIYAVTNAETDQIKQINSIGENTYPSAFYGELTYENGKAVYPLFCDIAVNSYGIITVADQRSSKLYQYDGEGNLLAVFGGKGDNAGYFQSITSICYDKNDNLYILDGANSNIHILEPTHFLTQIHKGISQFLAGDYNASNASWDEIRQYVSAYPLAQQKTAETLVKQGKYESAMDYYKAIGSQSGYATAFQKIRETVFAENFLWVVIIMVAVVTVLIVGMLMLNKYGLIIENNFYDEKPSLTKEFFGLCCMMVFHPIRTNVLIKRTRARKNPLPLVIIPIVFLAVKILSQILTAFQVSSRGIERISVPMEILTTIVPLCLFGFCVYGITSVFSGEMSLYETCASISYSLVPAIIFMPVLTAISYACAANELSIYSAVYTFVFIWCGLNIFLSVYNLNDITVSKTVFFCALGVCGVAIVIILFLLFVVFALQLGDFFTSVLSEIKGRLY